MTLGLPVDPDGFLQACSRQYDELVAMALELEGRAAPEATLAWVETAAEFASLYHPGRFADGALENIAVRLGRELPPAPAGARALGSLPPGTRRLPLRRRHVLHVATMAMGIGGLARTILNWIGKDGASCHSLALTAQGRMPLLGPLSAAVAATGGQVVRLPDGASILARAQWLRRLAAETADIVILHLHPYDVAPIVAFATQDLPPVALVNLADQSFWLGAAVADAVIHQRAIGLTSSRELRFTRNDQLLLIPMTESRPGLARAEARRELGIPESQLMLLSVGRSIKYTPSRRQSFFRAAASILERHLEAHLYLVGVRARDHAAAPGFIAHERLHCVGPIEDATIFQRAADVYLEGFPFGSQTALLESVLPGVACVPACAPATPLLATQDASLDDVVANPADEATYVDEVSALIACPGERERLGCTLRERVLAHHVGDAWAGHLTQVYRAMASLRHTPATLPTMPGAARPVDCAISAYHAARLIDAAKAARVPKDARAMVCSAAYALRERGCHGESFRFLRMANRSRVWDAASLLSALKLVPHKILIQWRRAG